MDQNGTMLIKLTRSQYNRLNARQKESYNFQKISAVLADFGFVALRLTDDWKSADFIAQHIDGATFCKVQLKGRLTFDQKYMGKDLYVAFRDEDAWYLYPHDVLLRIVLRTTKIGLSKTWKNNRPHHFPSLSEPMKKLLKRYRIPVSEPRVGDEVT